MEIEKFEITEEADLNVPCSACIRDGNARFYMKAYLDNGMELTIPMCEDCIKEIGFRWCPRCEEWFDKYHECFAKEPKKKGTAFIFDSSVIKKYIEGNDKNMDKILDKLEKIPKEYADSSTTVRALLGALRDAESIDGKKLKRLLGRIDVYFIMLSNGRAKSVKV